MRVRVHPAGRLGRRLRAPHRRLDHSTQLVVADLGDGQTMLVETRADTETDPERQVKVGQHLPFDTVAESINAISTSLLGAINSDTQ